MSGAQLRIDEVVEQVLDAIVSRIEGARANSLSDVKQVVRGDKTDAARDFPAVWVWSDGLNADHTTHGLAEHWTMPVTIASLVQNVNDTEQGYRQATSLAGRALQVVLTGQQDRLGELSFVNDITSTRFEPSSPRMTNDRRTLFWADAVVTVRLRRRQPSA